MCSSWGKAGSLALQQRGPGIRAQRDGERSATLVTGGRGQNGRWRRLTPAAGAMPPAPSPRAPRSPPPLFRDGGQVLFRPHHDGCTDRRRRQPGAPASRRLLGTGASRPGNKTLPKDRGNHSPPCEASRAGGWKPPFPVAGKMPALPAGRRRAAAGALCAGTPPHFALRTSHFALRTSHFALRASNIAHRTPYSTPRTPY